MNISELLAGLSPNATPFQKAEAALNIEQYYTLANQDPTAGSAGRVTESNRLKQAETAQAMLDAAGITDVQAVVDQMVSDPAVAAAYNEGLAQRKENSSWWNTTFKPLAKTTAMAAAGLAAGYGLNALASAAGMTGASGVASGAGAGAGGVGAGGVAGVGTGAGGVAAGGAALPAGGMVGTGTLSAADAALMGVGGAGGVGAGAGAGAGLLGTGLTAQQLLPVAAGILGYANPGARPATTSTTQAPWEPAQQYILNNMQGYADWMNTNAGAGQRAYQGFFGTPEQQALRQSGIDNLLGYSQRYAAKNGLL